MLGLEDYTEEVEAEVQALFDLSDKAIRDLFDDDILVSSIVVDDWNEAYFEGVGHDPVSTVERIADLIEGKVS